MSLWKFGNFQAEVDFTDADFLDRLHDAKIVLSREAERVPKTGKSSDIIRAQCNCYYKFFDALFWEGAGDEIFEGKKSISACIEAAESIYECQESQKQYFNNISSKYNVQFHGNRQQRRAQKKNGQNHYSQNRG